MALKQKIYPVFIKLSMITSRLSNLIKIMELKKFYFLISKKFGCNLFFFFHLTFLNFHNFLLWMAFHRGAYTAAFENVVE